ncbi:f-box domain containing protein [Colletotrichum plurivorum]|uniref:F-box domain containing protein n=1 Tax=Colletotrichum plurivorum TaxID=2175906 RepID=A0A8H6JSS5_9PEZI|nr:f-box domain containing protein [Colletotrichum plurivorum]
MEEPVNNADMKIVQHTDDPEEHRRTTDTTKQPDGSILHKLTGDELLCVIDLLDLHDKFRLSQTCEVFRLLAKRDWDREFSLLDKEQQKIFLAQMPNYWMCDGCVELHRLDKTDLPTHGRKDALHGAWSRALPYTDQYDLRRSDSLCGTRSRVLSYTDHYDLRREHVQMALKLTRMGGLNADYLRKLMSPFSLSLRDYRYRVTPKVVSGSYLVKREWEYPFGGMKKEVGRLLQRQYCAHMSSFYLQQWVQGLSATGLFDMGASTTYKGHAPPSRWCLTIPVGVSDECYDGRELEISISCPKCATDCSLKLSRERSIVQSWHKLGASLTLLATTATARRNWTREGLEEGAVRRMFEEAPEPRTGDSTEEELPTRIGSVSPSSSWRAFAGPALLLAATYGLQQAPS